jgi:hypothetical protein
MSEKQDRTGCFCPYCEEAIKLEAAPFCQPCQVVLRYCLKCNIAVEKEAAVCPQCGQTLD